MHTSSTLPFLPTRLITLALLAALASPLQASPIVGDWGLVDLSRPVRGEAIKVASASGDYPTFFNNEKFYARYIVDYWRQGGNGAGLPGRVLLQPRYAIPPSGPGVAELRAKLEKILARLSADPRIGKPLGVSMSVGTSGGHGRGPGYPTATTSLSLMAYPVLPDNPRNKRFPDGTVFTPGLEADALEITVNSLDILEANPVPVGEYRGMQVFAKGGDYMLMVSTSKRPLLVDEKGQGRTVLKVVNPDYLDTRRPPGEIQTLTVRVSSASHIWSAIARGREPVESGPSRLLGVMYDTDWPALLREVEPAAR